MVRTAILAGNRPIAHLQYIFVNIEVEVIGVDMIHIGTFISGDLGFLFHLFSSFIVMIVFHPLLMLMLLLLWKVLLMGEYALLSRKVI
ncbi:hypothetical protein GX441_09805 [bacterium]|nr:hypothetical protein [bacterium]